jgi:hypothetical protein
MTGSEILLNLVIGMTGSLIAAVIYEYARNRYPFLKHQFRAFFKKVIIPRPIARHIPPGYHLDHIRPYSLGGATSLSNLKLVCSVCHLKKST